MSFYRLEYVPKSPIENVQWRLDLRRKAAADAGLQRDLLAICRGDVLFWVNAFLWLQEPRTETARRLLPFISWPGQDRLSRELNKWLNYSMEHEDHKVDLGIEKSRGEGVTWEVLMEALHRWLFEEGFGCGLISRNEDCVDGKNPDALMPKLDWQIRQLPSWMWPEGFSFRRTDGCRSAKDHTLTNPAMESTIVGFAATGDAGAGGRKTMFVMDEMGRFKHPDDGLAMSATQYVTNFRCILGSYRGERGEFYKLMQSEAGIQKIKLPWWENGTRNRLLYRSDGKRTMPVDPHKLEALRAYEAEHQEMLHRLKVRGFFGPAFGLHSPWFDNECDRAPSTFHVAEELNCDPKLVKPKIFDPGLLDRLKSTTIQPPHAIGELQYDEETLEPRAFRLSPAGRLKLWCAVGADQKPPIGKYVLGLDLALGLGGEMSSNSTIVGIDRTTGIQVCEFVTNRMSGEKMAEYTTALAKWFWSALVNFESQGPGGESFYQRLVGDSLWGHLYYGRNPETGKRNPKPGFRHNRADQKTAFLGSLATAMTVEDFVPRSSVLVAECGQFEIKNSKVVHIGEQETGDEGAKGEAHGDVVIGAAMAWMATSQFQRNWPGQNPEPEQARKLPDDEIPVGSYAHRRLLRQRTLREEGSWLKFT